MIVILEHDPIQRLVASYALRGVPDVVMPIVCEDIGKLPVDVEAVITDRHMSGEWKHERDTYLTRIPADKVVEWTVAESDDERRRINASACIKKTGTGRELLEFIQVLRSNNQRSISTQSAGGILGTIFHAVYLG